MLVDIGSRYVNTDHIVSIEPSAGGCTATLITGKTAHLPHGSLAIEDLCGTIISAPPGMVLVEAFLPSKSEDDRDVRYRTSTVIAFRVTEGGVAPVPIGAFGEPRTGPVYDYAVVQPDGQCLGWEQCWDSLDAFKAAQQADADAQREPSPPRVAAEPAEDRPQTVPPADRDSYEQAKVRPADQPAEQLRARILAEPIESISGKAPWRPGRDFVEVIEEVRSAHVDLHVYGLGHSPTWGWNWEAGDGDRAREQMADPGNVEAFEAALRFLSHAGRRFPRAKVNDKRTSYSWKHVAERVMGVYVSNGMLIAAAYALGFTVAPNDTPNPCINLGEKAADLDPDRGV